MEKDKRFRRSLCALFFSIGIAATGVSLAYFTGSDSVTNRVESDYTYSLDIVLTEPKWDSTGELDAKQSVPGMDIDKDPYVTNYLPTDVCIRLKIDFIDSDGNVIAHNDGNLTEFDYYDIENCSIDANNKENKYSRFLSAVYFINAENEKIHLLTKNDSGTVVSGNQYFYYKDGWFYYLDYDNAVAEGKTNLKIMEYKEKTKQPLFTNIKLPVFKDEYNDLFADGFQIKVTAQAVDVAKFVDDSGNQTISTTKDMDEIVEIFETEFSSGN